MPLGVASSILTVGSSVKMDYPSKVYFGPLTLMCSLMYAQKLSPLFSFEQVRVWVSKDEGFFGGKTTM